MTKTRVPVSIEPSSRAVLPLLALAAATLLSAGNTNAQIGGIAPRGERSLV